MRPFTADPQKAASLASVARDAAGDLIDLVGAQVRLVRAEVTADLRVAVSRLARVMVFVPVLVVGYAFAMAALAAVLAASLGWVRALLAVAGCQLAVGGAGLYWALTRLRGTAMLNRAAAEASESVQLTIEAVSAAKPGGAKPGAAKPGPSMSGRIRAREDS